MSKVLIGSKAMRHHFTDFNREGKDTDYAVLVKTESKLNGDDNMVIPLVVKYSRTNVASPELLLTLKISHIFFDNYGDKAWEKHMWDIQFLLNKGVEYDKDLMLQLKDFWVEHFGGLYRSNLKQKSKDFFNNAVNCQYDHDYLHTILNPIPMYTKVLKDGEEVEPCEDRWNSLSNEEKDALIQEEVMVMAYERWGDVYYKKAYYRMFKKYLRNHIPMFMLDYMLNNYVRLSVPPYDFIEKINKGV